MKNTIILKNDFLNSQCSINRDYQPYHPLIFLKTFIILFFLLLTSLHLEAQAPPVELQEMRLIGELPGHVDVNFKVVKCDNSNAHQVFLLLHNESARYNQSADVSSEFDIVILNYDSGESFTKNISISISAGQALTANCGSESPLKIDLPDSYPPTSIAVYLTNIQN